MTGLHALQARAYQHVAPLDDAQTVADTVRQAVGLEEWPDRPAATEPLGVRDLVTAYLVVRQNLEQIGLGQLAADLLTDARHGALIALLAGILDTDPAELATRLDAHALMTVLPTLTDALAGAQEETRKASVRSRLLAPLPDGAPRRRP